LGNALKFTAPREKALIEISGETGKDDVTYRIKDNGIGFDMRLEPKLFGLFQRLHTSEEFSGNGIGLALCQRLVRRHSGEIFARAEPEKGAEFSFSLPKTAAFQAEKSE
jgi:light-regulated signal transduction histidine kinase (bacteriophytochrome)